jgi:hypothetical protein
MVPVFESALDADQVAEARKQADAWSAENWTSVELSMRKIPSF